MAPGIWIKLAASVAAAVYDSRRNPREIGPLAKLDDAVYRERRAFCFHIAPVIGKKWRQVEDRMRLHTDQLPF